MGDVTEKKPVKRKIQAGCLVLARNGVLNGIERCLRSIVAAGMKPIVLDDESTDDTYLLAKKYHAFYRYHSAPDTRAHEIWQTMESDLRATLAQFAMGYSPTLLATLDSDEWFMSPKTVAQIVASMLTHQLYDTVYFKTVNFWNDDKHVKVFTHDPNFTRPRIWRVDPEASQAPVGNLICTQAPDYVGEGRSAYMYNIIVGHTGYIDRATRVAKGKRYCELGAGQWARQFTSDYHVIPWDDSVLKGLP